ncbi:MAG: PAS domain S-box protein, partial [Candidatus Thiodiazotropha sp.]
MTDTGVPTIRPSIPRLILVFLGLFLLVPLMGLFVSWLEGPRLEQEAYKALESIALLKTRQIENWLDERTSDGRVLASDPAFIRLVQAAVENNQSDARTALRQRLLTLLNANHYAAISIIGEQADPLFQIMKDETKPLAYPRSPGLNPRLEKSQTGMPVDDASPVLHKKTADHVYYYVSDGVPHIDIAFSIYDSTTSASPFATLVLHVVQDHFLFPYSNWLPEDSSAEPLLVTQSGENVLFITPLHQRQTTMSGSPIRHPNDPTLPAAYALRHGKKGTFEGKDYRGIEVLAAYQAIDDTDWQLIAKRDRDEVIAPLDTLVSWVGLVTLCAAVLIGLLFILLWRQQQRLHASIIQTERDNADMLVKQFYEMPFIGIAITSPTSKNWLRFNDRLCEILGYPREELVEKNWAELTHPDDLEADRANFERVMRHESDGYSMDKRFIRKDGSLVHAYIDVKCVRDADGEVDYFVAMVQDISERKQAEMALEEARRQAQRYLDIAEVMIIALDTEGNIQMVNRRGCEILGYSEAELLGKSWFDHCLPRQECDEVKAVFGRLMAGDIEAAEQVENWIVTRSGEERIIAWHNTVLHDEHGAITAILSSGMDITVKHVAQQALATSDARLRALVRTIPDPMWLKDGNGVYLTCNPAFER